MDVPALLIALAVGFPVAVALGWMFDVVPGERAVPDAIVLRAEVRAVGMLMGEESRDAVHAALAR